MGAVTKEERTSLNVFFSTFVAFQALSLKIDRLKRSISSPGNYSKSIIMLNKSYFVLQRKMLSQFRFVHIAFMWKIERTNGNGMLTSKLCQSVWFESKNLLSISAIHWFRRLRRKTLVNSILLNDGNRDSA